MKIAFLSINVTDGLRTKVKYIIDEITILIAEAIFTISLFYIVQTLIVFINSVLKNG